MEVIRLKEGVSLDFTHYKIYMAIGFAYIIWRQAGVNDLWVTAAREHGHTTNPDVKRQFHWLPDNTCQACDLGVHGFSNDDAKRDAEKRLAKILGPEYDVLLENVGLPTEHMHVQYDPDRPGTK